jgi:RNA polymerase sigma factor (sigma-70 family)
LRAVIKTQQETEEYLCLNEQLDGLYYQSVRKAIENLPDRQKEVIRKLYQEEKDHQTVAEEMNIQLGTLYVLRSRAVSFLKQFVLNQNITEGVLFLFIICFYL